MPWDPNHPSKGKHSSNTFQQTKREVHQQGDRVTQKGEEEFARSRRLPKLVDPSTHDGMRYSLNYLEEMGTQWVLRDGIAMPVLAVMDGTGSMDRYMEALFDSEGHIQYLWNHHPRACAKRYGPQFATGITQRLPQEVPVQQTEYEVDNRIEEQMRQLVPKHQGMSQGADYHYNIWYATFRTKASIWQYGLKGYLFTLGDEKVYFPEIRRSEVQRLFGCDMEGDTHFEEIIPMIDEKWHHFYLQVGSNAEAANWWARHIGRERVVTLPDAQYQAHVQAVIGGFTEGTLEGREDAIDFLREAPEEDGMRLSKAEATAVVRAVEHIPMRAQAELPGFNNIPLAGSVFASREDIYPIGWEGPTSVAPSAASSQEGVSGWQL